MASPRIGGASIGLNLTGALGGPLPNPGLSPITQFNPTRGTNAVTLAAGESLVLPSGTFKIAPGAYTSYQVLDPVTGIFRTVTADNSLQWITVNADGYNHRLANLTGCPVGALITNASSGMTNGIGSATGLTVTPSSGASTWVPVVGGAINSTIAVTAGGQNFTYPPILVIDAPPVGGIQATAICTITNGAVNPPTVINQGAGYVTAPNITVINDSRDTTGTGAVLTVNATLVGSGSLTALYPSNQGTPLTAVPTFTFTPTVGGVGLAATVIMNFVVTGFTIGSTLSGAAYGTSQPFVIFGVGGIVSGTRAANTAGPIADTNLTDPQMAIITGTSTSGGKIPVGSTSTVVMNAGFGFQAVPNAIVLPGGATVPTTLATPTLTVGGITDTSWVQPV
jgi:hypothetical protein